MTRVYNHRRSFVNSKRKRSREPLNDYRTLRMNRLSRSSSEEGKNTSRALILLKKTGICIIIVLIMVVVKSINTPVSNKMVSGVNTAITSEFDFVKNLGRLKLVKTIIPQFEDKVLSVFKNQGDEEDLDTKGKDDLSIDLVAPMEGTLELGFGNIKHPVYNNTFFHSGIEIKSDDNTAFYSAADGVVENVSENIEYGKYIRIKHEKNVVTIYGHCKEILVDVDEIVKQGQNLGKIEEDAANARCLYFEVQVDNKSVDPLKYIKKDSD